ncbi:hypothetical protein ACN2XU_03025 [Primorskyibacter sp. 2E107]|uniref:hypothetical protein n=1 Tax=Primorskyibacter sp. 2E107 TaxID=3403458 RepID=UPI003AF62955
MAENFDITGYTAGEVLSVEILMLDGAGAAITTGSFALRLSTNGRGAADVEVAGVHGSGGLWTFTVASAAMAPFAAGRAAFYQVWEPDEERVYLKGRVLVAPQISPAA